MGLAKTGRLRDPQRPTKTAHHGPYVCNGHWSKAAEMWMCGVAHWQFDMAMLHLMAVLRPQQCPPYLQRPEGQRTTMAEQGESEVTEGDPIQPRPMWQGKDQAEVENKERRRCITGLESGLHGLKMNSGTL